MRKALPDWLKPLQDASETVLGRDIAAQAQAHPDRALRIRNLIMLPALRAGELGRAWIANDALVAAEPANALYWSDRASLATRRRDEVAALDAARHLHRIAPENPGIQSRSLQTMLNSGAVEEAAEIARILGDLWQSDGRLAHLVILVLTRSGQHAEAADVARQAVSAWPDDLTLAVAAADALLTVGEADEAIAALNAAGAIESEDARAWFALARARTHIGALASALDAADVALALDPDNGRALEFSARLLWRMGQPGKAENILAALPDDARTPGSRDLLMSLLVARGAIDQAAPLAGTLAEANPGNLPLIRRATGVLIRAGLQDTARALYGRSLDLRRAALPEAFAPAASALLNGTGSADKDIPRHRLEWLYAQLDEKLSAPADRSAWEATLHGSLALDRMTLDWLEAHPDRAAEITAVIDWDDDSLAALRAAHARGHGVLMASTHTGLIFVGGVGLGALGLPLTFVASTPDMGQSFSGQTLLSVSSGNEAKVGRGMVRALRAGHLLALAIDGAAGQKTHALPLFDRTIAVSDAAPRLAWRTRAPSFLPLAVPEPAGRVRIFLEPLPEPRRRDSFESFAARWFHAYGQRLSVALCRHPEAARASGGFWRDI